MKVGPSAEFWAATWTVEVTNFEPSTLKLTRKSGGSVTGQRAVGDMRGSVSGS